MLAIVAGSVVWRVRSHIARTRAAAITNVIIDFVFTGTVLIKCSCVTKSLLTEGFFFVVRF